MSSTVKYKSKLRAWISIPLIFSLTCYVIALSTSLLGMEIAAWASALFFFLFIAVDRMNGSRQVELYAIGVEVPLILFLICVILGLKINAPDADFIRMFGNMRNFLLLFIFCYGLQIYRNLNRLILFILLSSTVVAAYGVWQHFTGLDLVRLAQANIPQVTWGSGPVFTAIGLFKDNLSFGHSYMMLLCLPWAALLVSKKNSLWLKVVLLVPFAIILTSLVFTFAHGVWIAVLVTLAMTAFFASRKFFLISLVTLGLVSAVILKNDPTFKQKVMVAFSDDDASLENRRQNWEFNMDMFHAHPWIGVGYGQNEGGVKNGTSGIARSNYIQLLATTGVLGFTGYMLFILAFILMTSRLYGTIPTTHYWHRVFALAALGAQIAFHVGGLTQWNLGIPEVQHQFIFWLAVVAYMSQRYYAHIVPDDHSL